jgi:hypothetical protein
MKKPILVVDSFYRQQQILAIESRTPSIAMESLLAKMLNPITASFATLKASFVNTADGENVHLTKDETRLIKKVESYKYVNLKDRTIVVPEGFNGNWLAYTNSLLECTEYLSKLEVRLNDYLVYIGGLMNSPDGQKSMRDNTVLYRNMEKRRGDFNKERQGFFDQTSTRTTQTYQTVMQRNEDWKSLFGNLRELERKINLISRKTLLAKVEEIDTVLGVMVRSIQAGSLNQLTGPAVREVSEAAFTLAHEVEFFSVVYYEILTFTNAVNATVKQIMDLPE